MSDQVIDRYATWIQENTTVRPVKDGWVEVTTPFLDRHNDYIQFFLRNGGGEIVLTDDSNTVSDLLVSGVDAYSAPLKPLLDEVLRGFSIELDQNGELTARSSSEDLGQRIQDLIQAMLAVSDLWYVASPGTRGSWLSRDIDADKARPVSATSEYAARATESTFEDDVSRWLKENNINLLSAKQFDSRLGTEASVDFALLPSPNAALRVIDVKTSLTRAGIGGLAITASKVRHLYLGPVLFYVIIDDTHRKPISDLLEALQSFDVRPILWSQRGSALKELRG